MEKVATMAAAEASVAAATVLTSVVATRGGGGYGDPPRDITKWSLGAGRAISLRFFCDKLTNLGWLTLNLEEPVRVASPTRINMEEPVRVRPAQPGQICSSVHQSVSPSVCE